MGKVTSDGKTRICVASEPVKVAIDELTTELLRRFPENEIVDAVSAAFDAASRRLQKRPSEGRERDDRYKTRVFFQRVVQRIPSPPELLAVKVGLLKATDTEIPGAIVTPISTPTPQSPEPQVEIDFDDYPDSDPLDSGYARSIEQEAAAKSTQGKAPEQKAPPKATPLPTATLSSAEVDPFYIPTFDDFRDLFTTYPYVKRVNDPNFGEALLIGYVSIRDNDGALIRRNCVVRCPGGEERTFNDCTSYIGMLKRAENGVHRHVKAVPFVRGMGVRFWINRPGGDEPGMARFLVFHDGGVMAYKTKGDWDEAINAYAPKVA